MFLNAEQSNDGRKYATQRGIAFEAKPSADGTWHGYPLPWDDVPAVIKNAWHDAGLVHPADLKRYSRKPKKDILWALETDDS